ncbi:MAG: hypothetical protein QM654_06800 [Dysgonamonadaceae bacterium]
MRNKTNSMTRLTHTTKIYLSISISLLLAFNGCTTVNESTHNSGETIANITFNGIEEDKDDINLKSSKMVADTLQQVLIPFDDNLVVEAQLTRHIPHRDKTKAEEITNLSEGIKYKVVVYDSSGALFYSADYVYSSSDVSHGTINNLEEGKTYTFIVYSVNSTSTLPTITGTTLSTASLSNIASDLMTSKQEVTIQNGTNNIGILLKHRFSQITSTLAVDPNVGGKISAFAAPAITPTKPNANYSFAGDQITYNSQNTSAQVSFTPLVSGGVSSITSSPTLVISPQTTVANYNISSITVNNSTHSLSLPNIKITPGYKYNLNLIFKVPCTMENGVSFDADANIYPQTISAPSADYGFVFDIYYLDNSFNMKINGTSLATKELQFESNSLPARNMRFADGSYWGDGTVPYIWLLNNSAAQIALKKPIIRVVISKDGSVSLYGSKVSADDSSYNLYPLQLFSGTLNSITWNASGTNTVYISQSKLNITRIAGYGYGKKIVSCSQ